MERGSACCPTCGAAPACVPASRQAWRAARSRALRSEPARSLAILLSQRPVGDDPDVDSGQLPHEPRDERAMQDLSATRFVRCAEKNVRRAAFAGELLHRLDEV